MKRKIALLLSILLLLCSCNSNSGTEEVYHKQKPFVVEKLDYPFGKWMCNEDDMICWDCYKEGIYHVFVSYDSENNIAQYKVYSYDCVSESWKTNDFKWNSLLKKSHINMTGNYQQDNKGNIYFCGINVSNRDSVKKIYRIEKNGELSQMDSENDLIPMDASICSFKLLTDGRFLVATESQDKREILLVDFIDNKQVLTNIPASPDNMISLNTLTCLEKKFVRVFRQDAKKCAIRIQKFEETMPEKVIAFDYELEPGEGIYSWNLCASEEEDIFFCTSKGVFSIGDKETKEIVSSKELSDIFKEYQDVIFCTRFNKDTFYLGVQNSEEIASYKVFRQ